MALKLLHTADWHLGRRFPMFTEDQELLLTRARRETVARVLDLAESRGVDAVLCAGDLFDESAPGKEWWGALLEDLRSRDWTRPVILLPGNHDPIVSGSVYQKGHAFREGLPSYVHVVDRDDFELPIGDRAVVYGVPCRSKAGQQDPTQKIPARDEGDERIRIGLVHGQTFDIEGHQTNFPIDPAAVKERGLDYLALGDTHGYRQVQDDGHAPVVYPGSPEQARFDEQGAGQVAVVFFPLDRRRAAWVEPKSVGTWRWSERTCSRLDELRDLRDADDLRKTVLRLRVEMSLPIAGYDEAGRILEELAGSLSAHPRVGVLELDREDLRLQPPGTDDFPEMPAVLQSVVERLRDEAQPEPQKAERALHHLYELVREGGP